jgi:hypothetical protein
MRKLLLTATVVACAVFVACCTNEAPAEHLSPDGQWKYVSFDRNCGATTRDNLQVSVLPAFKHLPNEAANVFIADDNHGATRFVAQPEWVSSRELRIAYSPKAGVFKKESQVGPIKITHVEEQ